MKNLLYDPNISIFELYTEVMPESIYFKKSDAKNFGTDLLLLPHFLWPSSPSPGPPSGGERTHRCHRWTELPPAARSRRSGASVGPSHQTWETAGQKKTHRRHNAWGLEKFWNDPAVKQTHEHFMEIWLNIWKAFGSWIKDTADQYLRTWKYFSSKIKV